jgi:transformation/transcription domain-associated protein
MAAPPSLLCLHSCLSLHPQLPETGYLAQVPLLQVFQQLVELRESGRVLIDVHPGQSAMDRQYSDTKDILETWRWVSVCGGGKCV